MNVEAAPKHILDQLGIKRVVWIDDMFDRTDQHLLDAITKKPSLARSIAQLEPIIRLLDENNEPINESQFTQAVTSIIEGLQDKETSELQHSIRNLAAVEEGKQSQIASPTDDLETATATAIRDMLGIAEEDCIGFEDGLFFINQSQQATSETTAIIVDMQNALQGADLGAKAGIAILKAIYSRNGEEMVFVLTHEAADNTESAKESQIVDELETDQRFPCVISKSRLQNKTAEQLSSELKIALKRSALRREVYKVGEKAQKVVAEAIKQTRNTMCQIHPEELDHAFIQRAVKEGVSDLHMIERIISAQVSKSVQQMFVDDQEMHSRMRMLRGIQIGNPLTSRPNVIEQFRRDEIWQDGRFLAAGRAPLALGDVFETITGDAKRRFILLGQPCDIALRSDGKRSGTVGDLLSYSEVNGRSKNGRSTDLLIGAEGGLIRFDFYNVSPCQLDILDLATFNEGGSVSIRSDQNGEGALLAGQAKQFIKLKKLLSNVASLQEKAKNNSADLTRASARCKLTLRYDSHFNSICTPKFTQKGGISILDWNLKRIGRLRSPYVDKLMDDHIAHLSRRAFDLDYLAEDTAIEPQKAEPRVDPVQTKSLAKKSRQT